MWPSSLQLPDPFHVQWLPYISQDTSTGRMLSHSIFENFFLFIFIFYSKGRQTQTSSLYWFTPQMHTTAGTWTDQSQEPGTPSGSPTWVAGMRMLASSPAASQEAYQQGVRTEDERGLIPNTGSSSSPIWDVVCREASYPRHQTPSPPLSMIEEPWMPWSWMERALREGIWRVWP